MVQSVINVQESSEKGADLAKTKTLEAKADPAKRAVVRRVKELMKEQAPPMTNVALAKGLGVSEITVRRFLSGGQWLTFDNLLKIAELFDVPFSSVFKYVDSEGEGKPEAVRHAELLDTVHQLSEKSIEKFKKSHKIDQSTFLAWLARLDPVERVIVHMHLLMYPTATLSEIGVLTGTTKERVRQIERKAMDRLFSKASAVEK